MAGTISPLTVGVLLGEMSNTGSSMVQSWIFFISFHVTLYTSIVAVCTCMIIIIIFIDKANFTKSDLKEGPHKNCYINYY